MRGTKVVRRLEDHALFPVGALTLLALISLLLYLIAFVRSYFILDYVATPKLDLPIISGRSVASALVFVGTFLVLFALYALSLWVAHRSRGTTTAAIVILWGLVLSFALTLTYPIGANDIFGYAMDGEMLLQTGANPLVFPAREFPGAMSLAAYSGFAHQVSNYGPLWTWIEAAIVAVCGTENIVLPVLGFKAAAITAYSVTAILIYALLLERDPDRAVAGLLFFAWNPLILFEFAVNGHNDALMVAFVVLGIALWQVRRPLWTVVALTGSLLIKIPSLLLLPILMISEAHRRPSPSDRRFTLIAGTLLALILAGIAYLSLPQGAYAIDNLLTRSDFFANSLPALMRLLIRPLVGLQSASTIVGRGALLALFGYALLQFARAGSDSLRAIERASDLWLFLLLFATLWFQPWYVTWLIPLAALDSRTSARFQVGLFSLTVTWSYIVGGFVWFWLPEFSRWSHGLGLQILSVAVTYGLPWAYYLWWRRAARQGFPTVVKFHHLTD